MAERQAGATSARARALAVPVLIGLLLIMYAALGVVYWQEQNRQSEIEGQLAQLSRVLNQPREGLREMRARVDEARALVPEDMTETEVYPIIRSLAAQSGVMVESQTAGKESQDKIGDNVYRVMPFTIKIGGEDSTYQKVLNFIANLEKQQSLPTLFIDKASITRSGGRARATIDFNLYLQPLAKTSPTPTPKP